MQAKQRNRLRYAGSSNVGGMNTSHSRQISRVSVLAADFGKGALAAFIAARYSSHPFMPLLAVIMAMIGHNWVIWLGFKGGKGISTFLGGFCLLLPFPLSFSVL
ncbi:MAG: glycerol-3-phosphate acyltransferase [Actinomycetota bacterium]|nr:glycerol-3-phosphate acyltransferase [Actinomycetota bacterium]